VVGSGIAEEVIAARGYRTVTVPAELHRLGLSHAQCRVPALLVPIWSPHGEIVLYQSRPDQPRIRDDKPVKYETPAGSRMAFDVPPTRCQLLADPTVPLLVTEGVKKGDALVTHGGCVIGLLGVWNWRGTNDRGGKTVLPEWELVALNGRTVYLVFDSDLMEKRLVHLAVERLKAFLESRGATASIVYLPPAENGAKVGVDDFLSAGHTLDDVLALASPELRPLPREKARPAGPQDENPALCVPRKAIVANRTICPSKQRPRGRPWRLSTTLPTSSGGEGSSSGSNRTTTVSLLPGRSTQTGSGESWLGPRSGSCWETMTVTRSPPIRQSQWCATCSPHPHCRCPASPS
jgi:hypothetical protein